MKKITVEIDPEGNIVVEDNQGESPDVAAELEALLGTVTGRKQTCAAKKKPAEIRLKQHG